MSRRSLWAFAALATLMVTGALSPAHATFIQPPTAFTVGAGESILFTFAGYSADDTDRLYLRSSTTSTFVFRNKTTPVGTVFDTGPLAAGQYWLVLVDFTEPGTWSSDPSANSDNFVHLMSTTNFADFHIGSAPFGAPLYYGWEDEALVDTDADYNDLVFSMYIDPVPEPASIAILSVALLTLGGLAWRTRHHRNLPLAVG